MLCRKWSGWLLSLVAAFAIGCGSKDSPSNTAPGGAAAPPAGADSGASEEEHHHAEGPHGGTVTDWGGGAYHVEFTVDHDKREAVVYILGGDAKSPAPIDAEVHLSINDPAFEVELDAQPLEGEAEGTSSRFVGQHENLGIVREFAGTITGEVDGTPYAGDFAEVAHGHE